MRYGIALLLLLLPAAAWAHDSARPDLTPWFRTLKNGRGGYCCDGQDSIKLKDIDWDTKGGHYRARVNGKWFDIPDDMVLKQPNRDGNAMVWLYNGNVQCFMPGLET